MKGEGITVRSIAPMGTDLTHTPLALPQLTADEFISALKEMFVQGVNPKAILSEDGTFLMVNPAMCTFLNVSKNQLIGMNWRDVTRKDSEEVGREEEDRRQVAAGEQHMAVFAKTFVNQSDGHYIRANIWVSRVPGASGKHMLLVDQVQEILARRKEDIAYGSGVVQVPPVSGYTQTVRKPEDVDFGKIPVEKYLELLNPKNWKLTLSGAWKTAVVALLAGNGWVGLTTKGDTTEAKEAAKVVATQVEKVDDESDKDRKERNAILTKILSGQEDQGRRTERLEQQMSRLSLAKKNPPPTNP